MANNLSLDLWVAGVPLPTVGGVTNAGLDLFVAGRLYPGDTDGHSAGGGIGPTDSVVIAGSLGLCGVGK